MYKLLCFFALLAVAFAAPAAEPAAKAEPDTYIASGYPAYAPTVYSQPLGLYPATHLTYSAPVAAYPMYPAPLAYNKIYDI